MTTFFFEGLQRKLGAASIEFGNMNVVNLKILGQPGKIHSTQLTQTMYSQLL